MKRLTFSGRLTTNVICLWCYASWLIQWLLCPDKSSSNNIQIQINKINQGNTTLLCLFCQDKSNCIYSDLERSTSIFDLGSMSKGDLTRSYCISFDACIQEEHCKTYPRSLSQFSIQPKVISKNVHCPHDMLAKFRELGGKRDVDIAYFDTMLALWSLNVPENWNSYWLLAWYFAIRSDEWSRTNM